MEYHEKGQGEVPGYPHQPQAPPPGPYPGEAPPAYSQVGQGPQQPPGGYPQYPPPAGYPQQPGPPPPTGYAPVPQYPQQPHYPQQPGYGPPPPQPAPPVQVVHVAAQMRFGETPVNMTCPFCSASIITGTEYVAGTASWLGCLACCGIGLMFGGITWLGCCLIPFCVSACQDVEHRCPNCRKIVGKLNRL